MDLEAKLWIGIKQCIKQIIVEYKAKRERKRPNHNGSYVTMLKRVNLMLQMIGNH